MQRTESENDIQIAVVDETYFEDESGWETRREKFRLDLEREYSVDFEDADIGPSVSLPAFVTFIVDNKEIIGSAIAAAFFSGKRIEDSWNWWASKAKLLRKFGKRRIRLNRNGAAILAVEAVMAELPDTPSELKLLRYGVGRMGEADDLANFKIEDQANGPTDTLFLGFVRHVFEIDVDGQKFRVGVDGSAVEIIKLS